MSFHISIRGECLEDRSRHRWQHPAVPKVMLFAAKCASLEVKARCGLERSDRVVDSGEARENTLSLPRPMPQHG